VLLALFIGWGFVRLFALAYYGDYALASSCERLVVIATVRLLSKRELSAFQLRAHRCLSLSPQQSSEGENNRWSKRDRSTTMTAQDALGENASPYRVVGWVSMTSGALGLAAFGSVVTALRLRVIADPHTAELCFGAHDIGATGQYLCLIPVVLALWQFSQERPERVSRSFITVGIAALSSTAILLLVEYFNLNWLPWYMVPQGVFGTWLILFCWRQTKVLPAYLAGLGMIVGFGLVLVGTFPLGYTFWVDPFAPDSVANRFLHRIVEIGSYLGIFLLPFWTILVGVRLLRVKRD